MKNRAFGLIFATDFSYPVWYEKRMENVFKKNSGGGAGSARRSSLELERSFLIFPGVELFYLLGLFFQEWNIFLFVMNIFLPIDIAEVLSIPAFL